jgi:hypothetical protein
MIASMTAAALQAEMAAWISGTSGSRVSLLPTAPSSPPWPTCASGLRRWPAPKEATKQAIDHKPVGPPHAARPAGRGVDGDRGLAGSAVRRRSRGRFPRRQRGPSRMLVRCRHLAGQEIRMWIGPEAAGSRAFGAQYLSACASRVKACLPWVASRRTGD